MTSIRLLGILAGAALAACASVPPKELVSAREAYRRASAGTAATVAPADLHVAKLALDDAERTFKAKPDSYRTRDLAYIAERKAQIAEAKASISAEQGNEARSNADYQTTQGQQAAETKQDLTDARSALATSEQAGAKTAEKLAVARDARLVAEQNAQATQDNLAAEQRARAAAEQQTAVAQAALAKLAAVREEARGLVITLSGSVLFASNQAVLLPVSRTRLDQVADVLLANKERHLVIEGHTDSRGSDATNLDLSRRRAEAVRAHFVQRGYDADLITVAGIGEGRPVASNESAEGRANNRRVEIVIERKPQASNP
jgi:outer membrane protein OmpA-like peptidoglycan-associated protein